MRISPYQISDVSPLPTFNSCHLRLTDIISAAANISRILRITIADDT